MKDLEIIRELTIKFRVTIENMSHADFGDSTWFSRFPKGCCGDTSDLLSKYLLENGIKAEYVCGIDGNQSHAWLEYNGCMIDITAKLNKGI